MIRTAGNWLAVAGIFGLELGKATWDTIRAVLGDQSRLRPAILAVPLDVRSNAGITLFADMVTLTPGTTSIDVAPDGRTLYVHVLDAAAPDATVRQMKESLEVAAMRVLA